MTDQQTADDRRGASTAAEATDRLLLDITWDGEQGSPVLRNEGPSTSVQEVSVLRLRHDFAQESTVYGEGFQMLAQYSGDLGSVAAFGPFDDWSHYRLPRPNQRVVVWNVATITEPNGACHLYAFASCDRFNGQIRVSEHEVELTLLTEGLVIGAGETWELETIVVLDGTDERELLDRLGAILASRYPRASGQQAPTGWCSWYWYLDSITPDEILANAEAMAGSALPLHYVQIDDGYESRLGDWLSSQQPDVPTSALFHQVRERGGEPAIWVAPFIAERDSSVARAHPEWFVQDEDGRPLEADRVTFGGWRNGPWLMLDATVPAALDYLRDCFRVMSHEWGCRYFKLDATVWGALPFGVRADPTVSTVEAYRAALVAIREVVGADSLILGCNAPMWPSLGLVDAMRLTDDIARNWETVELVARSGFARGWQHRLWIPDPDCLVLHNTPGSSLSQDELDFHAAYVLAMAGSVFSGDSLPLYGRAEVRRLAAFLPGCDEPARFVDGDAVATARSGSRELVFLFNRSERERRVRLTAPALDHWTGAALHGELVVLPAHSARVLRAATDARLVAHPIRDPDTSSIPT